MIFHVLTLFPEMFAPVSGSILGRAANRGVLDINVVNIRDYSMDRHKKTDETPFGGGAGMVMSPDPVFRALRALSPFAGPVIYLSPKGRLLDQKLTCELSLEKELILLCGHYEGIDQRIIERWSLHEISIGDYILTGGELPAMVVMDAVSRMVPGVLGSSESHKEESISFGLLEYPHYTRPREYEGQKVPDVLLSGNHKQIRLWRFLQSLRITHERRPDLFYDFLTRSGELDKDEMKVLMNFLKENGIWLRHLK